jgi:hypothetical protein
MPTLASADVRSADGGRRDATLLSRQPESYSCAPAVLPLRHDGYVGVKRAAEQALCERLRSLGVPLDHDCRAEHLRDVVLDTVDDASLGQTLADLRKGSGGELTASAAHRPKFHSAYSSCALAVNVFGPWRLDAADLELDGESGFGRLRFEAQFPIFDRQATPPNLDVLIDSDGRDDSVAIESKLTEYLAGNENASFADRYDHVVSELADPTWGAMYSLLKDEPHRFTFLNAAQLVKHYLGLKRAEKNAQGATALVYAYWEPSDPEAHDAFALHRREVESFTEQVADPAVTFKSLSYQELWREWLANEAHVAALRARYDVAVGPYLERPDREVR